MNLDVARTLILKLCCILRISVNSAVRQPSDLWKSTLTLSAIDQAWKEGINEPLRTAERVISRLLRSVEQGVVSKPLVVVWGGDGLQPGREVTHGKPM